VFVGAIRNHSVEVADELGLPPHTVATFGLAVGALDSTEAAGIKPRLPHGAVLHHERVGSGSRATGATRCSLARADRNRWQAGTPCAPHWNNAASMRNGSGDAWLRRSQASAGR
jgi:hypothetical protein